jgi:hypothetical protein
MKRPSRFSNRGHAVSLMLYSFYLYNLKTKRV